MINAPLALLWHAAGKIPVKTVFDRDTGAPSFFIEADAPDYAIEHRARLDTEPFIKYDPSTGHAVYTVEVEAEGAFEVTYRVLDQKELAVLLVLIDVQPLNS